jgi:hypothetical protein
MRVDYSDDAERISQRATISYFRLPLRITLNRQKTKPKTVRTDSASVQV